MMLQKRDHSILASLARYGILSTKQIGDKYFSGVRHTTLMRRLRALEKENLIVRARGLPASMSAWYLSVKGVGASGASEIPRYTNQNVITHEVALSSVRMCLESVGLGADFTPERVLKRGYEWKRDDSESSKRVIPDGILVAAEGKKTHVVALELELQPKNHARLRNVLGQYAKMTNLTRVMYVASTRSIANLVLRQWDKVQLYNGSPEILVCLLEELLEKKDQARVFDIKRKPITLSLRFNCKTETKKSDEEATHKVSGQKGEPLSRQAA